MKRVMTLLAIALAVVVESGCSAQSSGDGNLIGEAGQVEIWTFCDPKYGIEYLVAADGDGVAITPRRSVVTGVARCLPPDRRHKQ